MKIKYTDLRFRSDTIKLIGLANEIIDDYQSRGYELTVRQLYYQLVARDLVSNTEKSYTRLVKTISNGRLSGLIDWNAIVDRTRIRNQRSKWNNPQQIINAVADQYRIDKWKGQKYRCFVWVEKEALAGVVQAACTPINIQADFLSCRGYMSQSTIWREGINLKSIQASSGQIPVILHLGDHDPSGMDMTRDNVERLALFSGLEADREFLFRRIALNYPQIEEYNPPPNPTKTSDARAKKYIDEFGYSSWELDALDPDVLIELIKTEIGKYQNQAMWEEQREREEQERAELGEVANNWEDVKKELNFLRLGE